MIHADFAGVFEADDRGDDSWSFRLGKRFNGAFGGINGGVLAAISVYVARRASGRRPIALDSRFIRGFRPGIARVALSTINDGRVLTTVGVDIVDDRDKLCTRSTVTLANEAALAAAVNDVGSATGNPGAMPTGAPRDWSQPAPPQEIPLIETFRPRSYKPDVHGTRTASNVIWSEADTAAEAACIAADLSVGPPVARLAGAKASTPNPDLSLRFCAGSDPGTTLVANCRAERIDRGVAVTRIDVWSEAELLAIGVSTTTCIPLPSATA